MKKLCATLLASSLSIGFLNTAFSQSQYFTTNILSGGTYSWDAANWNASGTTTGPYTFNWTPGDFARFSAPSKTYTVTLNASESISGFIGASGATINFNDAGGGTGALSVVANTAQATQNGFSWLTQGFLTGGGTMNVNVPITGSGGVEEESGGGNINLYGNNTFTGGFLATSSSTFIGFNNNNSFGAVTSQIGFDGTTFAIMNNTGPTTVNIANPVQTIGNTGVNFIGNSSTMSGNWFLGGGSSAINIRNNGAAGSVVTLAGVLSGTSGNVTYSGANGGIIVLGAVNTYTGTTVIGSSGDTAITLRLGVANAIASSKNINMAGGKLDFGGFSHSMGSTTLTLSASSSMDFTTTGSAAAFANSSAIAWTGSELNLLNYGTDGLRFGTDSTGLTQAQLNDIAFNGVEGGAYLDGNGFLVVPEPSSVVLGLVGGAALLVVGMIRRRTA